MRRFMLALGALAVLLGSAVPTAAAQSSSALRSLRATLKRGMHQIGGASGAYVIDLNTGATLFGDAATVDRLPASVQKLYTTSAVLLRFGPTATLTTSVLGQGSEESNGVWSGTLYLKGGGDPTFGWASFDRSEYGGHGATVERLVANLSSQTHITRLNGSLVGDPFYLDSRRGTAESNYKPDSYMEGELSGLAFDRGFASSSGSAYQTHPARYATQQIAVALRQGGIAVPSGTSIRTGHTSSGARLLATVSSPRISKLIQLTNTPSDNFMAEMLLKDLGARFGADGTTADGAALVRSELASMFGIHPRFNDGSGLSYQDHTSPAQVVTLLRRMAQNTVFVDSLAVGGETGTLKDEMTSQGLRGRCRGKTGTLHSVANLSGYCRARDGHTLAFAFLANGVSNTDSVHSVEANNMAAALVRYNG